MKIKLPIAKGATKPKRPCLYPGCSAKVASGYCDDHRKNNPSVVRANSKKADPFYLSARWRKTSRLYRKHNPLCRHCKQEGRVTPAECVDHIIAIKQGGEAYNWDNLQSLCLPCHTRKTRKEQARGE